MTAPVTTAAPPPATPARADAGGADGAAPFASALVGALAAGRGADAGRPGRPAGDRPGSEDTRPGAGPRPAGARLVGPRTADGKAPGRRTPGRGTAEDDPGTEPGAPADRSGPPPAVALLALWALAPGSTTGAGSDGGPVADTPAAVGLPAGGPAAAGPPEAPAPGGTAAVAEPAAAPSADPAATLPSVGPTSAAVGDGGAVGDASAVGAAAAALSAALRAASTTATGGPPPGTAPAPSTGPTGPVGAPTAPAAPPPPGWRQAESSPAAAGGAVTDVPVLPTAVTAAGSPGTATGSGDGPDHHRDPDPATPAPLPAPGVPTAAPVTPSAPPTAPAPASPQQPVAAQLVPHVAVLRGGPDGTHSLTVVLTPETLGPVQVQVTLERGTVDLTLRGAHQQGRDALLAALPDLRRDLQSAGLTCSRLDVDRDTGGSWSAAQQQAADPRAGSGSSGGGEQPGRGGARARPWVQPTDPGEGRPALTSDRSTSSGVDVRV